MKPGKISARTAESRESAKRKLAHEALGAAAGAAAGATAGAFAGPAGAAVGGVVGGIAGAIATAGLERASESEEATQRKLDDEIGISGGDLGAPNLLHPPAKIGAYSAASAGASGTDSSPSADGPFQVPGDG